MSGTERARAREQEPGQEPERAPDLAGLAGPLRAISVGLAPVILPHDGRRVELQHYVRNESVWLAELPSEFGAIPNKVPYELDGAPLYPELVIVRLLEAAGWSAAWRKTWNGEAYWRDVRQSIEPPDTVVSVIEQISAYAGHSGQWDILAWRDRQLRLLTSRQAGGQLVSAYQAAWLSVALRTGLPIGCFAVVEHRVVRPPRRRRLEHTKPA